MSYNKVILIGNVGRDPDVRYFDSQNLVANFSVATNEFGYTKSNGEVVPEQTDWHNITTFRDTARFVEKYVRKGSRVLVEGRLRYRSYTDTAGISRTVTEIVAEKVNFMSGGRREITDQESDEENLLSEKKTESAETPNYDKYTKALDKDVDDLPF